jgi:hypothetical protein
MVQVEDPETTVEVKKQGYTAMARGMCQCGVVCVLCYQPLPASPTFSLYFDIYALNKTKKSEGVEATR